jgi:hypothetical protein
MAIVNPFPLQPNSPKRNPGLTIEYWLSSLSRPNNYLFFCEKELLWVIQIQKPSRSHHHKYIGGINHSQSWVVCYCFTYINLIPVPTSPAPRYQSEPGPGQIPKWNASRCSLLAARQHLGQIQQLDTWKWGKYGKITSTTTCWRMVSYMFQVV